jgi:hypothetical protein
MRRFIQGEQADAPAVVVEARDALHERAEAMRQQAMQNGRQLLQEVLAQRGAKQVADRSSTSSGNTIQS